MSFWRTFCIHVGEKRCLVLKNVQKLTRFFVQLLGRSEKKVNKQHMLKELQKGTLSRFVGRKRHVL